MTSQKKLQSASSKRNEALLLRVLERVAAIFLRLGFDAPKSEYLLRSAFILAAKKIAESKNLRITQSQIALIAGVNRLDVRKLTRSRLGHGLVREIDHQSRIERVLEGWRQDPRFLDARGQPKSLSIAGRTSEFAKLTRLYGRDTTVRTLREMLVRSNFAKIKGSTIFLNETSPLGTTTPIAGQSDLAFLSSQLASLDFHTGRRTFVSRHLSLSANDAKSLRLLQRKAIGKIETALGSLESVATRSTKRRRDRRASRHRLLVKTTVTSDTDTPDFE